MALLFFRNTQRCVSTFDENIYSDKCQTAFKRSETNGDDKNKLIGEFENRVNAKPKSFKSLTEQNNSFDCMPQEVAEKHAREMEKLFVAKGKRIIKTICKLSSGFGSLEW